MGLNFRFGIVIGWFNLLFTFGRFVFFYIIVVLLVWLCLFVNDFAWVEFSTLIDCFGFMRVVFECLVWFVGLGLGDSGFGYFFTCNCGLAWFVSLSVVSDGVWLYASFYLYRYYF